MLKKTLIVVAGMVLAVASAASFAGTNWSVGVFLGAPVYGIPYASPPPVYYVPPRVVYAPPPVYYTPSYYAPPYYAPAYGYRYGNHQGWERHHHEGWRH